MTNDVDMDTDTTPPGRVNDLKVTNQPGMVQLEFTAPGDDLDSNDSAAEYIIKYSSEPMRYSLRFQVIDMGFRDWLQAITFRQKRLTTHSPIGASIVELHLRQIGSLQEMPVMKLQHPPHRANW